jgi:hypothetical protein
MDKLLFWLTVVVVSILGIFAFKTLAGLYGPPGLKAFAAKI